MLSSRNDSTKVEERFQGRIDVLTERVDTLASTVATTASAIAKKDGEIAMLRRDVQARDEQLQALAARLQTVNGADPRELHELRQTVGALANEKSKDAGKKQIEQLAAKIALLAQRLDTVSTTVSTTAAGLAGREGELATIRKQLESRPPAPAATTSVDEGLKRQLDELATGLVGTKMRLDSQQAELDSVKAHLAEPNGPAEELRAMLTTLRARVESLDGLRHGVSEEQLDERLAETSAALDVVVQRVDSLADDVDSATTGLGDKERELAALHRHFTESSARIESIVDDLREALGAFPAAEPDALVTVQSQVEATAERVDAVGQRLERLEATRAEDLVADLVERLDVLDRRVSTIAAEIARAKTLWPVALRSLEARLDDMSARSHEASEAPAEHAGPGGDPAPDAAEDLLAGLRDSLHAMETVAAEMERASEAGVTDEVTAADAQQAIASGARIVPLRASDP